MLPKMAFTGFASRYREPTASEGFQDITKVDFKVCIGGVHSASAVELIGGQFRGTEEQKAEWKKYWIT